MEDFYGQLGQLVRERREERGLTQEFLADHLGLSRVSMANIERGCHRPLFHHVMALAVILNISLEEVRAYYLNHQLRTSIAQQEPDVRNVLLEVLQAPLSEDDLNESQIQTRR